MKINNNFGTSGINPYKRQMNKLDTAANTQNKKADKVEISSTAKEMQQLSQVSVERKQKVDELKIQVENGTYKPDSRETAKSILNFFHKK
ncbi:flagellar biosynthesis anti-sigma factor FlgM [Mesobacillus jeotgali]|uniref:flagellar biosynthesis anti-sigma factor FlgM n=1 Tax=Mesobacillus jeotgali TaxID=129985 RepID=UPI0009A6A8D4|nr:flagellar biosynthesis anti-sigma factor FlgM [Mesobacillus jeotgali]